VAFGRSVGDCAAGNGVSELSVATFAGAGRYRRAGTPVWEPAATRRDARRECPYHGALRGEPKGIPERGEG